RSIVRRACYFFRRPPGFDLFPKAFLGRFEATFSKGWLSVFLGDFFDSRGGVEGLPFGFFALPAGFGVSRGRRGALKRSGLPWASTPTAMRKSTKRRTGSTPMTSIGRRMPSLMACPSELTHAPR